MPRGVYDRSKSKWPRSRKQEATENLVTVARINRPAPLGDQLYGPLIGKMERLLDKLKEHRDDLNKTI